MAKTRATTSTLARGLKVLETVAEAENKRGLTLQEITEVLDWHKSNVYRYITTLVEQGWIIKDEETFRYRLSTKLVRIASQAIQHNDLRTVAHPVLEALSDQTLLAAHLGVLDHASIVYIDKVDSPQALQMRSHIGMTAPCYSTAMGKAILANMPPEQVRNLLPDELPARTSKTLTHINHLLKDLAMIRIQGYSTDMGENEDGIGCIGAAVYGFDDEVMGAISVSTLLPTLSPERIEELAADVLDAAETISLSLGSHRYARWREEVEYMKFVQA